MEFLFRAVGQVLLSGDVSQLPVIELKEIPAFSPLLR